MANPFEVASFNLTNFANIYPDLMDDEPKDVEYVYKDENGNIRTKSVANRGKFKKQLWDDVGGALGQMSRTFYVDQVNGDDNNNGSSSYPFKTLKKAIDSVPVGGYGHIYITGSDNENSPFVYSLDAKITLRNKSIHIYPHGITYSKIKPTTTINGSYEHVNGFFLENSSIFVAAYNGRIKIENASKGSQDTVWGWTSSGVFNLYKGNACVAIGGYTRNNDIVCNDGGSHIINVCLRDTWAGNATLSFQYVDIKQESQTQDNKVVNIYQGAGAVDIALYATAIKDINDNAINLSDVISGIIRDGNSIPRNITSNIIL